MASHGYIVVGFDAPYRTSVVVLPNNRVVTRRSADNPENLNPDAANRLINRLLPMWISDTKFKVNRLQQLNASDPSGKFARRLDLQRLGMFGHSFGGATALHVCHEDARCKSGDRHRWRSVRQSRAGGPQTAFHVYFQRSQP